MARVAGGLLDLAHREGHEGPEPLVPGRRYEVRLALRDAGWAFLPGHRIRLAVSTAWWPIAWPSRAAATVAIETGSSRLELPVRPPREEDAALRPFEPPEAAPPLAATDLHPGGYSRSVERDPGTGEIVQVAELDVDERGEPSLSVIDAIDLTVGHRIVEEFRIRDDDPSSARAEIRHESVLARGPWRIRIETRSVLSSAPDRYRLRTELAAREGEGVVFAREWDEELPRGT